MAPRRAAVVEALRQRLFSGLHLGVLREGERLPAVRDLARELEVNPRVVIAAYEQLQREGLVELRPRSGAYVATAAKLAGELLPQTADWIVDVLLAGFERGIAATQLAERITHATETLRLRAVCIECNSDQMAALCDELRADYGLDTAGVDVADLALPTLPRDVDRELRRADLLVTTPFHVGEVQPVAEGLGKPWVALPLRSDLFAEIERFLPLGPVYFVVSDERFAEKLHKIFATSAGRENLRPLLFEHDRVDGIPPDAPAYVTLPVRQRLGESPLLARALPVARVTASGPVRQLLSYIVRENIAALGRKGALRPEVEREVGRVAPAPGPGAPRRSYRGVGAELAPGGELRREHTR